MGCCGEDPLEETKEGVVVHRKCRDVLCLLLFIAFWAGMFLVCGIAYQQGDINRLVYGVDSYGFTCGQKTTFMGQTFDLSSRPNLYYLNPLELLSVINIPFAKTVCVDTCPSASTCGISSFPCTDAKAFRCPYYAFTQSPNLTGLLPGVDAASASYYSNLTSISSLQDSASTAFVNELIALNLPWVNSWLKSYHINNSGSVTGLYYQLTSQFPGEGPCNAVWVPTASYFNRCFPQFTSNFTSEVVSVTDKVASVVSPSVKNAFTDEWNSVDQIFSRYVGDISKGIVIIVAAGLGCSLVLCLVWLVVLRYFAGVMCWLTILLVNVLLCGITLYCFSLAGLLGNNAFAKDVSNVFSGVGDPTAVNRSTFKYIAIAAAVVAGVVLLITLLMIRRIKIAIACIKVASQAVGAMPSIMFYPIIPFALLVGLVLYWISVTALLYTAGSLTATCRTPSSHQSFGLSSLNNFSVSSAFSSSYNSTSGTVNCYTNLTGDALQLACSLDANCYLSYTWDNNLRYAFIYHFFGLLWTNQFIVGLSCVTISGAIGSYYWAGGDTSNMSALPVIVAMKNTFIYHLGSIAFGSLIIAIIQFIRYLLEYLDKKTKTLQDANAIAAWLMCCVKCCAWCLEKIVAYINHNAYIIIGLKGTSYCSAAMRAIELIITNALRLATVGILSDLLLFLGKLAVAAACGLAAFGLAELNYYTNATDYPNTYLSSPVLPVALSILVGYVVAQIFFSTYEMAIDTIMLAFCEDCELHDGNPKWAPPLLMEAMGLDGEMHHYEGTNQGSPHAAVSVVHVLPKSKNTIAPVV
ncbi:hypothetical protein CEUSTIGMA_g10092.t1 [Chlamydomonas eustigma]|uniref:Choline transporter-like protein n=1 Tax=Chlamydomonas eustigma TaxID=1157962 RepID=A0A250XI36_9CHLO|nr:hypothetical protein CEUSTIGMA_g10092.t1 [Chlamydomonas eustigma]|eukprot:GAX82666.1 hypothetical protein CEUSTIGMA_g10092.t1 [Chlamydomonas eustigma]